MTDLFWTFWWTVQGVGWTLTISGWVLMRRGTRACHAADHAWKRGLEDVPTTPDEMRTASGHIAVAERLHDTGMADYALARRLTFASTVLFCALLAATVVRLFS